MVFSLDIIKEPVGSVKPWLRANNTVPVPFGWYICDGTVISDPSSDFNGKAVPDMRSTHMKGHSTITNANFGSNTTYFAGGAGIESGGSATININHSHNIGGDGNHNHNVSVGSHSHSISTDGSHGHNASTGGSEFFVFINALGFIVSNGSHSHGSATGSATPSGSADFQGNHNHGGGTGANLSTTQSIDPVFHGLVYIIKIK